ncbi:MAG: hypothetical protein ACFFG0_29080 [Candidatus Thorarchaeota archaeon]
MELKLQFFIVYIIADLLIIIGWFIPFLYYSATGIETYIWIWGLFYNGNYLMLALRGDILMMQLWCVMNQTTIRMF